MVFGLQVNQLTGEPDPGEFHRSAHTAGSLRADLEAAGFEVLRVEMRWTHNQETLQAVARKPKADHGLPESRATQHSQVARPGDPVRRTVQGRQGCRRRSTSRRAPTQAGLVPRSARSCSITRRTSVLDDELLGTEDDLRKERDGWWATMWLDQSAPLLGSGRYACCAAVQAVRLVRIASPSRPQGRRRRDCCAGPTSNRRSPRHHPTSSRSSSPSRRSSTSLLPVSSRMTSRASSTRTSLTLVVTCPPTAMTWRWNDYWRRPAATSQSPWPVAGPSNPATLATRVLKGNP